MLLSSPNLSAPMRWFGMLLAIIALILAAWMTRYEHIRFVTGETGYAEWRWDRWLHRTCLTVSPAKGKGFRRCTAN